MWARCWVGSALYYSGAPVGIAEPNPIARLRETTDAPYPFTSSTASVKTAAPGDYWVWRRQAPQEILTPGSTVLNYEAVRRACRTTVILPCRDLPAMSEQLLAPRAGESVPTTFDGPPEIVGNRGHHCYRSGHTWVAMRVDADDLQTRDTDDRGRIYLGTEYANKRITVAVVEVETKRPDEDELAAAYRDASESAESVSEEWREASDEAWGALDE